MNYKDNKIKLIALFSYIVAEILQTGCWLWFGLLTACDQRGGGSVLINCCRFTAAKKGYVTRDVTVQKDQSPRVQTK